MPGHCVHPSDDDDFTSGNGTAGLEIVEDLPDVDAVVAAVGGGGLLVGVGVAFRALRPQATVYAAEPETAAPLKRSMELGKASRFDEWQAAVLDGAGGKSVLRTVWPPRRGDGHGSSRGPRARRRGRVSRGGGRRAGLPRAAP